MPRSPTIISSATRSYEKLEQEHHWRVPARFNIAEAVCERHARTTPDAPAEQPLGRTPALDILLPPAY
ncbi:MAG: hypothetical protein V3U86_08960 [Acidobacteriota bacterium]